jgi:alpha-beta hydrolase superfamily lysophospholipase
MSNVVTNHLSTLEAVPFVTEHMWIPSELGRLSCHISQPAEASRLIGACLLLPAVGYPYWSAYRTLRELAESLAAGGIAAVRLDYHGTGNSEGTGWEPGRLRAWQDSVDSGLRALRAATDLPVGTVGMQLGAVLARQSSEPRAFEVAWDPVVSGRRFVRSLRMLGQEVPEAAAPPGDSLMTGLTMAGSPFPQSALEDLAGLRVAPFVEDEHLRVVETHPSVLAQPAEEAVPPRDVINATARWCAERVSDLRHAPAADRRSGAPIVLRGASSATETERVVRVAGLEAVRGDPGPRTRPVDGSATLVFLNSGSEMNAGPGRAWVEYSRALNAAGVSTVRLDFSGWGESEDRGHAPGRPYDAHCVAEAIAVVEALRATGQRVVLVGLCAGAWVALKAATAVPLAGVVAINPQLYWRPGDPVEALISTTIERRAATRARIARGARWHVWTALDMIGLRSREGRWLDRLRSTGTPVLMLFAEGDEGLLFLRQRLARRWRKTLRSGRIRVVEVPGIDHPMHRAWLRGPVSSALVDFARATGPRDA